MSTKNPEEMNDEELEAAENAAREATTDKTTETTETTTGAGGETTKTGETTATAETTSTTTEQTVKDGETTTTETPGTTAAADTAGAETGKVAGVASKDGTRVLPYSALQAERRSARQASARADRAEKETERLKGEIEDLRAGKSKVTGEVTEEEVQRMEADFPEVGAKMRAVFDRNQDLAKQIAAATPKEVDEEVGDDPVQEAIDQVPMLVEWQHDAQHQDKWKRAVELDNAFKNSPKWREKPAVERFEHVASMVAEEFDIKVLKGTQQQASTKTTAKQTPDPAKAAVDGAQRQPPSTLSDLKGGAVPDHGQVDFSKMPPQRMLGQFMDMDDDAIDRHLAKLG